ncbi:hypothetical protein AFLA_003860 [Aspergillus flavus NRRL3357]|nr:hypothetical protein AFLA_003860 [Aspergillus flavus NRRL3357]
MVNLRRPGEFPSLNNIGSTPGWKILPCLTYRALPRASPYACLGTWLSLRNVYQKYPADPLSIRCSGSDRPSPRLP